ncbi:MAG: hypothetical protein E7111_08395 [Bacteroidales bacterium]|nr:hypothetical protein [Bacteroidales bacterium]
MLLIINRKTLNGKEVTDMKKIFISLASLAMIACVQEKIDAPDNAPVVASFEASREDFGGVKTRTTLADGCRVEWIKDDAVAVFDGKGIFAFKADKSGPKAVFGTTDEAFDASADAYIFVYPYIEGCVVEPSKVQFNLAGEQKAVLNSFDPSAALAVAKADGLSQTVRFVNPLSLLKFTVPAALDGRVTKITVKGNGESDILGGQLLCDYSGATPVASLSANGISQMSLVSASGMTSGDYYLAVLPGTVQGLTLTVTVAGKNYPRLTNADTDKTFKPGYIHDMGEVSISEGTLLDVAFRADGSAYDRSAYGRTVKYVPKDGCLSVYKNYNLGGYVANFTPATMGNNFAAGFYQFDYDGNSTFKSDLENGFSMETLFRLDQSVSGLTNEIKMFSSQNAGGAGLMISKNDKGNEITFLPNVTTTSSSNWIWTRSGITPQKGQYYHVVGVYDKTNQKTHIYVNGAPAGSYDAIGNYRHPNSGSHWFCVGGDAGTNNVAEATFDGDIAIARVYSEPLSASKVTELYNASKHIIAPTPNPLAKIIAHKGYHPGEIPENSLAALKEAQKLDIYGSEFDVYRTADGKVVVYHDRTLSVNGVSKNIFDCTYEELQTVRLSNGENIPTLEQFLEQGKQTPKMKLICEIKYHNDGNGTTSEEKTVAAAEACHAIVSAAGMTSQVEYISVNAAALKRLAVLSPGVMLQDVNSDYPMDRASAVAAGIKGINYDFNKLTDAQIADAHEKGMVVGTWTVDKEEDMRTMINRGVDFITTNEPVLLQQVLETL